MRLRVLALSICVAIVALIAPALSGAYSDSVHEMRGSGVLVIGDSHTVAEVLYNNDLRNLDVDAKVGRNSDQGYSILKKLLNKRHKTVVFDIATNDYLNPSGFKHNLNRVLKRIKGRRLILVNSHIGCGGSNKANKVNRVIRKFSLSHGSQVHYVDWAGYVDRNLGSHASDCIHFTASAYARRAKMINAAIW